VNNSNDSVAVFSELYLAVITGDFLFPGLPDGNIGAVGSFRAF
jgi:hypothetical protein